jgi:hypothetical protein
VPADGVSKYDERFVIGGDPEDAPRSLMDTGKRV